MNTAQMRPNAPAPDRSHLRVADQARRLLLYLNWQRGAALLLAAGALWRVVRYAMGFPIWGDEAFIGVDLIRRDYAGMLKPLTYGQIVPLFFMWAELAISRALGLSEYAVRLLPFAAGLASLALFAWLAARVLPRRVALLALGIFAASYYPVRHSCELKPYSTDLLTSLVLLALIWQVHTNPRRIAWWVLLTVCAGIAPWCSYPSVFITGSGLLLLAWQILGERPAKVVVAAWVVAAIAAGGGFTTMYLLYGHPQAVHGARLTEIPMWSRTFPPLGEPLKLLAWFLRMHTGYMLAYPHGGDKGASTATAILVVLGAVRLWSKRRDLVLLLLIPLGLTFIAAALHKYPYGGSARTSLYMAPSFCLLAGTGLMSVLRRFFTGPRRRLAVQITVLLLAVTAAGGAMVDVFRPYKSQAVFRSRLAVQTIRDRTGPLDLWVVFNSPEPVSYAPYLGDWRGVGGQFVFDVLRFAPVQVVWAPPPQTVQLPARQGRVFLLSYRGYKVPFPDDLLKSYLEELTGRLGTPTHERFLIKTRGDQIEALDVYVFGLNAAASPQR